MSATKSIYHQHHLFPKHTDPKGYFKDYTIKVTVEEHAEIHGLLYDLYRREKDWITWLALSGQIKMTEAKRLAQQLGAAKGCEQARQNKAYLKAAYANLAQQKGIHSPDNHKMKAVWGKLGAAASVKLKRDLDYRWITNGIQSKRIPFRDLSNWVNQGWKAGRIPLTKKLCPYCTREFRPGIYARFHGDSCKLFNNSNINNFTRISATS